ncbi:M42 family peptidase [Clostridium tyrobutyricum]|uniref:M42 family metallopeptidase n=1 Tax=Clostridium tyrobutyricum TaxID=1519 RepID=UPI001C38CCBE|nr:M42 family peptidase [Clostridium tyrobutyricum]MBV4420564.1 M42 family peptidase [Clostridium tyrobutyricum]
MLLEKLCNSIGPSGYEGDTRNLIKDELKIMNLEFSIDNMGNILVHKKGKNDKSNLKIMLSAHMDECGLVITSYNSDGTLKFSTLGSMDINSLPCKTVLIGKHKVRGVIGLKPIHLQNKKERTHSISLNDLCIDIGSYSKSETKSIINLGDFAQFNIQFEKFSDNIIKSKALNGRLGCSILLDMLKEDSDCDLYAAFNVQENIGQRGVFASNYSVKPDIFVSIDTVNANDLVDTKTNKDTTIFLGRGPIIPFKAGISMLDRSNVQCIRSIAEKSNIVYQKIAGTRKEGQSTAAQLTGSSIKILSILIPCRYMNSIVSMCDLNDYENTIELLKKYIKSF